ncbi:serine/threonine-protein kinase [Streptomyces liangshanensis]|uniref:Serine/threonine protein kinase n=1 Tax=Streptomyces liangshanensis TaxID=2717324 RepID=A0A6G9GT81_9ACTN|nr:serine/threonine-protein kinase [Streptomyces liangshanensis]QIQ01279.1 serine/threonine protein kinase [Streptomyces liangshanensis]
MTDTPSAAHFKPLGEGDPPVVGGYRLAAVLGAGGMGKVYLSYTPGGRPVALKVIRPEFSEDPEFRRRFHQEVQSAQRVQGLYTAPVIDFDTEATQPWLATSYVPGPSLAEAVARHGALPLRTVLLLTAGVAEALHVIHGAGIIHRDLKPANVLLASDGPRVIDFGIARAADATSLTGTGVSVGTPAFMAPEQASAGPVSPATDVFALGQIAAFAALGSPAYGNGSSPAVLYRIVHEDPDLTGVPAELLPLVSRCLHRDPAARPGLTEIIELCHAISPVALRQGEDWLPRAVAGSITERLRMPGPVPPPSVTPTPTEVSPPHAPPRPWDPAPGAHHGDAAAPTQTGQRRFDTPPPPRYPVQTGPGNPGTLPPPGYPTPPGHRIQPTAGPAPYVPPRPRGARRGLIVGASIVGAVVVLGVVGSLLTDRSGGDESKSPGSSASRGTGGDASGGKPGLTDPEPVSYKGIDIPENYSVMLADSPPRPTDGITDSADLFFEPKTLNVVESDQIRTRNGTMVLLNNARKGSLQTCRSETRYTEEIRLDQLSDGSQICLLSDAGHIAVATYRGTSGAADPSRYVTVDFTIWRNAEEPKADR